MTPKQLVAIRTHGEQLNAIFRTGLDPVVLCKNLRRIEGAAHKLAEDCCNYLDMESTEFENRTGNIKKRLTNLLGNLVPLGIFINLDPRGYALKINSDYMRQHNLKLYTDWGGYGIIAPEFGRNGE